MPGKRLNTHRATASVQVKIESVLCFGMWECKVNLVIVSVMITFSCGEIRLVLQGMLPDLHQVTACLLGW